MLVVPRSSTPLVFRDVPGLLDAAFRRAGAPLTPAQRVNLAVLVGIETGRGAACKNHNVGNITAGSLYQGAAWRPPWFDESEAAGDPRLEALHVAMLAGRAPSAFRAYGSLAEGADDFARTLIHSFPEVLEAARDTDAERYREALGQKYSRDYRANRAVTDTIAQLQRELGLAGQVAGGGAVLGLVAFVLWRLLRKSR